MSAAGFVQKYSQRCPDCQGNDFVDDHQQGDLICRERPVTLFLPNILPMPFLVKQYPRVAVGIVLCCKEAISTMGCPWC